MVRHSAQKIGEDYPISEGANLAAPPVPPPPARIKPGEGPADSHQPEDTWLELLGFNKHSAINLRTTVSHVH